MCVQAVNKDWDEEVCLHSTSGWHPAYLCIVMAHEISPGLGLNAALSGLECGPYGSHILLHGTSWQVGTDLPPWEGWEFLRCRTCVLCRSYVPALPLSRWLLYTYVYVEHSWKTTQETDSCGGFREDWGCGSGGFTLHCAILNIWPWPSCNYF